MEVLRDGPMHKSLSSTSPDYPRMHKNIPYRWPKIRSYCPSVGHWQLVGVIDPAIWWLHSMNPVIRRHDLPEISFAKIPKQNKKTPLYKLLSIPSLLESQIPHDEAAHPNHLPPPPHPPPPNLPPKHKSTPSHHAKHQTT